MNMVALLSTLTIFIFAAIIYSLPISIYFKVVLYIALVIFIGLDGHKKLINLYNDKVMFKKFQILIVMLFILMLGLTVLCDYLSAYYQHLSKRQEAVDISIDTIDNFTPTTLT
ncbi:hypothetical protein E8L90_16860 [Brevibacillus antibioticus]|uniref:Uncharacterized protein n=1 Tax=Brevibacillus antibioticus TaxID=2570228 RepID=A0A4U2Y8K2_9BACL|nr:hypothetical protein [Brevibacillus antibioticus]TKI57000.1 hypothetical protein E8L90_16860 [Brevibacillus antibioticus]